MGGDYEKRRRLFLAAVRAAWRVGGDAAVEAALGDTVVVDEAWHSGSVEDFRAFLRARVRGAQEGWAA